MKLLLLEKCTISELRRIFFQLKSAGEFDDVEPRTLAAYEKKLPAHLDALQRKICERAYPPVARRHSASTFDMIEWLIIDRLLVETLLSVFSRRFRDSNFSYGWEAPIERALDQVSRFRKRGDEAALVLEIALPANDLNQDLLMNMLIESGLDEMLTDLIGILVRKGVTLEMEAIRRSGSEATLSEWRRETLIQLRSKLDDLFLSPQSLLVFGMLGLLPGLIRPGKTRRVVQNTTLMLILIAIGLRLIPRVQAVLETAPDAKSESGLDKGRLGDFLLNLLLDHFDSAMMQSNYGLVRYRHHILLTTRTEHEGRQALEDAGRALAALGLKPDLRRTHIARFDQGVEFLGHTFHRTDTGYALEENKAHPFVHLWELAMAGVPLLPGSAVTAGVLSLIEEIKLLLSKLHFKI